MNNVQLLKNYGTYSRWFRNDIVSHSNVRTLDGIDSRRPLFRSFVAQVN